MSRLDLAIAVNTLTRWFAWGRHAPIERGPDKRVDMAAAGWAMWSTGFGDDYDERGRFVADVPAARPRPATERERTWP